MPYSDNLYSIDSDDEYPDLGPIEDHHLTQEEQGGEDEGEDEDPEHVLSPADGNFPAGTVSSRVSSSVPHVPNILVRDPSLEQGTTAESKAREARQERLANTHQDSPNTAVPADDGTRPTSPQSSSAYPPTPSTISRATHYQPSTAGAYSAYTPSTAGSHTASYAPRQSIYTQRHPLLPAEAPPAYTPSPTSTSTYTATTSPTSPTSDLSRNYRTFSQSQFNMGRAEESRGLLAHPESMGGPPAIDDEYADITPAWRDRVRRRLPYLNWRNCRYASVCLVLLLITVGFLMNAITSVIVDDDPEKDPSLSPPNKSPVLEPPHMDYPPYDGDLPFPSTSYCTGHPISKPPLTFSIAYGPGRNFSFVQDVQEHDPPYDTHDVRISGDFVVRRAGAGTPDPSLVVESTANFAPVGFNVDWDADNQRIHVSVPRKLPRDDEVSWPCLSLRATLWVPGDAVLDSLAVETVHLGIRLMDNLALQLTQFAHLTTVVGPIVAATDGTAKADDLLEDGAPDYFRFDSRHIEVKSTSAPITGYWPLYDYLGLSNIAGPIKVRVQPREEKSDAPKPAVLYVKSLSGNIEVWEPVDKAADALSTRSSAGLGDVAVLAAEKYIPPRDYRVNVQSTSGTIKGAWAFSSACRIHSTSGNSMVELLPVLDVGIADRPSGSNLETSTTSGTVKIQVLEPLWIGSGGSAGAYLPPAAPTTPSAPPAPSASGSRDPAPQEEEVTPIGNIGSGDPYKIIPPTLRGRQEAQAPPALRCLQSRHASTSANIRLSYPASWEGDLDMGTISGSFKVSGDGLKVIKDGKSWPGVDRHLVARKGKGGEGSVATVKTISGDVRVVVGDKAND